MSINMESFNLFRINIKYFPIILIGIDILLNFDTFIKYLIDSKILADIKSF